ncbi:MAG: hypothetical protein LBG58_10450 [Planctomycetaceae bacterium]|jgi:adenine-specific DNA-methyltransferase|nr:hypothetical protein [Planctomycetaceae bacterium]
MKSTKTIQFNRFVELLKTIFELDKSDLDFGIYRIMNIRKAEITDFLENDLLKKVQETLIPFASNTDKIKKQIAEIKKQAAEFNADVNQHTGYVALKSKLEQGTDLSTLETDVYSHLYNFFSRYYDEGDFISKRRYKEGVYAMPYEGEEVKLIWANQDQYYIKTTENFKNYSFTFKDGNGNKTVHFRLVDASIEQNNNKEQDNSKREFMLWKPTKGMTDIKTIEVNDKDDEMIIRFVYDIPPASVKRPEIKDSNYQTICKAVTANYKSWNGLLNAIPTKDPKKTKTLLEKHLETYIAKNTFDYFIHKDLDGFLRRELDFYIKNEIIHLDDIDTANEKRVETYLAKVKAVKQIGKIIIDFLAQIENFQKKLYLKKKFVVSTDWCITLDKIPETFYDEIRNNKTQIQEWINLYAIDEIKQELTTIGYSKSLKKEFLKQNQHLILDTKFFTAAFKEKLIATIDNLDEQTNGVLIHSENFQALNLLQERYKEKIDCVYIDPPYNSSDNDIPYKNGYKDSSWLSLINNSLVFVTKMADDDIVFFIAIDDYEIIELSSMLRYSLSEYSLDIAIIEHHPQGGKATVISTTHEYMIILMKKQRSLIGRELSEKTLVEERAYKRSGTAESNFRANRMNSFYAILVNKDGQVVGNEKPPTGADYPLGDTKDGYKRIYPIGKGGVERVWRNAYGTCMELIKKEKIICKNDATIYQLIETHEKRIAFFSVLKDKKYNASTNGANLLKDMSIPFKYPKSIFTLEDTLFSIDNNEAIVLDYFAGSGTTGHAVINLNREDDGNRKYILVEMGEYFNTVTKPRMQKAVYAKEWKDGKPVNRNTGISHIIKYFRLESYEDTLSNIVLSDAEHTQRSFLGDDYLINYMLETESQGSLLNLEQFKTPFEYKLNITEKNEQKETVIDLVETFNYLIGLTVQKSLACTDGFKTIIGELPSGKRAVILWRDLSGNAAKDNKVLETFWSKVLRKQEKIDFVDIDEVFINGDAAIAKIRNENENFVVRLIESVFKEKMFKEEK